MTFRSETYGVTCAPFNSPLVATAEKLRTVVVDRSPSFVAVICARLEFEDLVDVVGMASNECDAIEVISHPQPDLIFIDIDMLCANRETAWSVLRGHFPESMIIIMFNRNPRPGRESGATPGLLPHLDKSRFREDFISVLKNMIDVAGLRGSPAGVHDKPPGIGVYPRKTNSAPGAQGWAWTVNRRATLSLFKNRMRPIKILKYHPGDFYSVM